MTRWLKVIVILLFFKFNFVIVSFVDFVICEQESICYFLFCHFSCVQQIKYYYHTKEQSDKKNPAASEPYPISKNIL